MNYFCFKLFISSIFNIFLVFCTISWFIVKTNRCTIIFSCFTFSIIVHFHPFSWCRNELGINNKFLYHCIRVVPLLRIERCLCRVLKDMVWKFDYLPFSIYFCINQRQHFDRLKLNNEFLLLVCCHLSYLIIYYYNISFIYCEYISSLNLLIINFKWYFFH